MIRKNSLDKMQKGRDYSGTLKQLEMPGLKDSETQIRRIINNLEEKGIIAAIGDGITIQDTNFKVHYQNEAHKRLLGDHIGEFCYRAYEHKENVCEGCPLELAFKDGKVHVSERSIPTDTGIKYIEITASPLKDQDEKIIGGIQVVRDITERKRTAGLIELSKKIWENTFDAIDDVITIHDRNFNIIHANKAAEKISGVPVKEIVKLKCYQFYHGEKNIPFGCPSCNCLKTGKSAIFELFEPHLNKYLEIKAIPRSDQNGHITGLIHIVRDITERKITEDSLIKHHKYLSDENKVIDFTSAIKFLKDEIFYRRQAEEALRISEKKYRELYDNAPDMYHTLDKNRIIIDCNETEAVMLGYKKNEIIGKPAVNFLTEKSQLLLEREFSELKKKRTIKNLQMDFVRKDGTSFPVILNVFADFDNDGELIRARVIARDITEIKKSERELKKVNRTLKALSDFNQALLYITDEIELLNETCRIIVDTAGYLMAWVGYIIHDELKTVRPQAWAGYNNNYLETVRITWDESDLDGCPSGEAIRSGKMCMAHNLPGDINYSPWHTEALRRGYNSMLAIPLFSEEKVIGSLNIYASEPDAFNSEERALLNKLAANLSYGITVLRTNAEREHARAEAMRASHLASIGELAAGVAHEINNPINGIINYSQILINTTKEGTKEHDIASRIIKESDRIAGIVRSLLSFTHDRGQEKRPVKIHEIISETLSLTGAQLRKDGIKLKVNIPSHLPHIFAQPQQIEQVFLNLISNSRYTLNRKYSHTHEDKFIEITVKETTIEGQQHIQIEFYDRGSGISANLLNKIANPFFTTKPSGEGIGLGLSICQSIVTNHGGNLSFESVEGEFTKVIVTLPASNSR
jgi:PAS domain S-box-containing protein